MDVQVLLVPLPQAMSHHEGSVLTVAMETPCRGAGSGGGEGDHTACKQCPSGFILDSVLCPLCQHGHSPLSPHQILHSNT